MIEKPSVLFVCLGNICRSPLAEGAFRAAASEAGLDVDVDSAGTGKWHVGNPPDKRAIEEARRNGVDIAGFCARQVTAEDFTRFTHIYALDEQNLSDLRALAPDGSTAEIGLLLDEISDREGQAVTDPYHGDASDFTTTWDDVSAAAEALAKRLTV